MKKGNSGRNNLKTGYSEVENLETHLKRESLEKGPVNKLDTAVNKSDIAVTKSDIAVNKSNIAVNKSVIAVNKTDIAVNKSYIAVNTVDKLGGEGDSRIYLAELGSESFFFCLSYIYMYIYIYIYIYI